MQANLTLGACDEGDCLEEVSCGLATLGGDGGPAFVCRGPNAGAAVLQRRRGGAGGAWEARGHMLQRRDGDVSWQ